MSDPTKLTKRCLRRRWPASTVRSMKERHAYLDAVGCLCPTDPLTKSAERTQKLNQFRLSLAKRLASIHSRAAGLLTFDAELPPGNSESIAGVAARPARCCLVDRAGTADLPTWDRRPKTRDNLLESHRHDGEGARAQSIDRDSDQRQVVEGGCLCRKRRPNHQSNFYRPSFGRVTRFDLGSVNGPA